MAEYPEINNQENDSSGPLDDASKTLGTVEKMGCACLNLVLLLLIIAVATILTLIWSAITDPVGALWKVISGAIKDFFSLF